ncbi:hypothetical protein [Salinifilum aidingensis]
MVTRLAITGHRGLPTATAEAVDRELRQIIAGCSELVGLSCLADGADSQFARAVLDRGGSLTAIVPAAEYRDGLPAEHHATYDALFEQAADVVRLDHVESTEQSHMDASETMLDMTDELIAVWDGQPARGFGGTADVVAAARDRGLPVTVVWPDGASRD